ncbi:Mo-dependent nitrogenase C-terminal domain-containing protein [Oscillatoria sp. FACHB-1407]|uniref:Mo-dependent nitrogenase C-terminal domain-containing protein n=1 Tax=Oscillatoria sp. FACHB-1407 TaxID=2692847 RepID=UPI00168419DB|nr:Mo-dependent nitrogenase C-terminal domain-containing protein [Oscillatoria sp. FACHB-1407]MBD2463352.1 Mo-dependent nitrogenase C-terminal domain-containing protein [Oscillatoria sp. FACHB-1407]
MKAPDCNQQNIITQDIALVSWIWLDRQTVAIPSEPSTQPIQPQPTKPTSDLLQPLRHWLDNINVRDAKVARRLCQLIPAQCPFERTIRLFGRTILRIPPLCKLNPLYDEVVALRFRALCYLADECGEDITPYC